MSAEKATELQVDPDYANRDMVNHLDQGKLHNGIFLFKLSPKKMDLVINGIFSMLQK